MRNIFEQMVCEHEYDDGEIFRRCRKCQAVEYRYKDKMYIEPLTGMKFVWIQTEKNSELESFWMSESVVTRLMYFRVMQKLTGMSDYDISEEDHHLPEYGNNYMNILTFCKRLKDYNKMYGEYTFRVQTKEEHEYAACYEEVKAEIDLYEWTHTNLGEHYEYRPVKLLLPNKFGLYDMNGNAQQILFQTTEQELINHIIIAGHAFCNTLLQDYFRTYDTDCDIEGNSDVWGSFRLVMLHNQSANTQDSSETSVCSELF